MLVPKDKFDNSTVDKLMELNENEIAIILPQLFEWIADFNWPIASDILEVIVRHPDSLLPLIKNALSSTGSDDILKYWIIVKLLPKLPLGTQYELLPDIERICNNPSKTEELEEVLEISLTYIQTLK